MCPFLFDTLTRVDSLQYSLSIKFSNGSHSCSVPWALQGLRAVQLVLRSTQNGNSQRRCGRYDVWALLQRRFYSIIWLLHSNWQNSPVQWSTLIRNTSHSAQTQTIDDPWKNCWRRFGSRMRIARSEGSFCRITIRIMNSSGRTQTFLYARHTLEYSGNRSTCQKWITIMTLCNLKSQLTKTPSSRLGAQVSWALP